MSMDYIRRTYRVPARRGGRVVYTDSDGVKFYCTIKSATSSGHLRVLVDDRIAGYRWRMKLHPTFNLEYLDTPNCAWPALQRGSASQSAWLRDMANVGQEIFRHKKTGGIYAVVCNAASESDGALMVVYRNVDTGERWVRPAAEFNDGRFVQLTWNKENPK